MIVQHYAFRCDAAGCDVEYVDVTTTPMDWETASGPIAAPPKPLLPTGWTRINDEIFCPAHLVSYS